MVWDGSWIAHKVAGEELVVRESQYARLLLLGLKICCWFGLAHLIGFMRQGNS